jgi:hypothetical protein
LTASPNVVRSSTITDRACAQVQAIVTQNGVLVDGALVQVTTTLGSFVGDQTRATTRGVATFEWCASLTPGTATITGTVEEATATVLITIF